MKLSASPMQDGTCTNGKVALAQLEEGADHPGVQWRMEGPER